MCYSAPASFTSFVISVGIAVYLIHRNYPTDRWLGSFIISFALIQLWEGFLHLELNSKSDYSTVNERYTKLILMTLLLQPLVQCYFAYLSTKNSGMLYASGMYLLMFGYGFYRISTESFQTRIGQQGHLVWSESGLLGTWTSWLYLFGIFIPLIWIGYPKNVILIGIGLLTLFYSLQTTSLQEFSSFWCFTAVAFSVTALLV